MDAYCSRCGEKRVDRGDSKLSSIAGETFSELVNVEHSKVWQTLRLLVTRPGQLTREYWDGRRNRFIGPVKLYLLFFALSLLLYSIHQPTAVYDVRTLAAADPSGNLSRLLNQIATDSGAPLNQVAREVNSRWHSYISWSQLLYPVIVAAAMKLLFRRRQVYLAEHLIFSLHLLAFTFLVSAVLWPLYFATRAGQSLSAGVFSPGYLLITAGSLVWPATYLVFALRRVYDQTWLAAIGKGAVIFGTYFVTSMIGIYSAFLLAVGLTSGAPE
jgi:hypothetical protein